MPFPRPSLTELVAQTAGDFNAELPGVDALLRYSNMGIISTVLAGLANGHYGYLDWIALQSTPFTATDEYLEAWAALKGVIRKPATAAIGAIAFPATTGSVVPSGTPINRTDGAAYVTTSDATGIAAVVTVEVAALVTGASANAVAGTAFVLGAGISGVSSSGSAAGPITGGSDLEVDADLRSRMLAAYATPPQGGSITDYPGWALAVPGVTRAWVKPGAMGPGTLSVFFMMDNAEAAHGGFPQGANGCSTYESRDTAATGDQLAVANALFGLQSVTALVYAVAPIPNGLSLTIAGIASASAGARTAIAAAVASSLLSGAVPGGVTDVSVIEVAIAAVPGSAGFVLTNIACSAGVVAPGAAGNITSNAGALPILAGITYV